MNPVIAGIGHWQSSISDMLNLKPLSADQFWSVMLNGPMTTAALRERLLTVEQRIYFPQQECNLELLIQVFTHPIWCHPLTAGVAPLIRAVHTNRNWSGPAIYFLDMWLHYGKCCLDRIYLVLQDPNPIERLSNIIDQARAALELSIQGKPFTYANLWFAANQSSIPHQSERWFLSDLDQVYNEFVMAIAA